MRRWFWLEGAFLAFLAALLLLIEGPAAAADASKLTDYFPPPESKGGWRSLLPETGAPDAVQKAKIKETAGVDWDKLATAWEYNAAADGATGLLVIRKGQVVGEWYKDCKRETPFNIYSSSKAYTSVAFGLLLDDSDKGQLPGGKKLTLDTKVCNKEWLPESLPLSDERKADITVRELLNMLSGIGSEPVPMDAPFETSLGKTEKSPFAKLKGDPGKTFNYSNAGVAHLVLVFLRAAGKDLHPFMKERVFDPIGMEKIEWQQIGGKDGKIGPFSQGFSGVMTNARQHARFCYLALHKGDWNGKQVVPAGYYDFAWAGTKVKPEYGAQWWVFPRHKEAPKDMVQTAGARNNHGYVVPSMDLVFVRTGDGQKYEKAFEQELVKKILAAVSP
ncbi:MAG: beta-lactamase family protein [Gemmataceae bacterium]|nr:beta-lactamase family protein [Gemmataceae bacterium]